MRVLLFEEDLGVRTFLLAFLTRQGYEVMAYQGATAMPDPEPDYRCSHEKPCADVLLMDLRMRSLTAIGITGLDLIEYRLKNGCQIPPENIALLSGYWTAEYAAPAYELGCQIFEKPFRLTEIQEWLSTRTPRSELVRSLLDSPLAEPICPLFCCVSYAWDMTEGTESKQE